MVHRGAGVGKPKEGRYEGKGGESGPIEETATEDER